MLLESVSVTFLRIHQGAHRVRGEAGAWLGAHGVRRPKEAT